MKTEVRSLTQEQSNLRFDKDARKIYGYAMKFNSRSKLLFGKFYEQILPEAVDGLVQRSDVLALLEHDRSRGVLGRSEYGKGSLTLTADDAGLRYEFSPPNTSLGDEVIEYLVRGDIKGSSFHFLPDGVRDKIERQNDGKYLRTITKFNQIVDVSLTFTPAYPETSAALRSIAELDGVEKKLSLDQLAAYYAKLDDHS